MARTTKTRSTRTAIIPRPHGGPLARVRRRIRDGWFRALEAPGPWLLFFLLICTWALFPDSPYRGFDDSELVEGAIASRDYEAPVDFPVEDTETTEAKRLKARDEVLPVYDFDSAAALELDDRVAALFAAGRQLTAEESASVSVSAPPVLEPENLLTALEEGSGLRLSQDALQELINRDFSPELEDRIRGTVVELLRRGVVSDKALVLENQARGVTLYDLRAGTERHARDLFDYLDYPDEVRSYLSSEMRRWSGVGSRSRTVLTAALLENITPNLNFNSSETLARRDAADAAAEPVFVQVRRGQVILRKGDLIDASAIRILASLDQRRATESYLLPILGTFLLLLLTAWVLWLGVRRDRAADHSHQRVFNEGLILLTLSVLGAKFSFLLAFGLSEAIELAPFDRMESFIYAAPFAALPLMARLLLGSNAALVLSLLLSLLAGRLPATGGAELMVYVLGSTLAAVYLLDFFQFKQRLAMTRAASMVGAVNAVLILILIALGDGLEVPPAQIGFALLCGFLGGILSGAVASFGIPILESMFSISTEIKLVELANTNLPALRRLAFEAPGTFQHSLMVANLAKEGCEAIDADSILAYTGALYHDIGKVFRPEYFIENQRDGRNRHDKLVPSMSALILINHVKEGLELAREYGLPQSIRDAIGQHHGTRLITYFYKRAQERCGAGEEVAEEEYRYPGPKPTNKVMGVLMLADGVEAASRTLSDATPLKIRELIRQIFDDCLRDDQLDESDLTLSELRQVSEAFQRVLSNIYHRRIDYPGFDFNKDRRQEPEEAEPAPLGEARAS